MALYWVEARSYHKMYYVVESEDIPDADELTKRINEGTLSEVAQTWEGEQLESVTEVSPERYKELWEQLYPTDHPYHEIFSENRKVAMENSVINLEDEVRFEEKS